MQKQPVNKLPQIVGILNLTPDSFSDGGRYFSEKDAFLHSERLIAQGADILDIGAESTRPGAPHISQDEEWSRLSSVVPAIKKLYPSVTLSIDTRHPDTAKRAIESGADWINDVSGFCQKAMIDAVKNSAASLVIMHNLGVPADPNRTLPDGINPAAEVTHWAKQRIHDLIHTGINPHRIIIDPGIGFGKTALQSLALIQNAERLKETGQPVLIGHSRKSFLTLFADKPAPARDLETHIVSFYLAHKYIDYLRVHDVEGTKRALSIAATL